MKQKKGGMTFTAILVISLIGSSYCHGSSVLPAQRVHRGFHNADANEPRMPAAGPAVGNPYVTRICFPNVQGFVMLRWINGRLGCQDNNQAKSKAVESEKSGISVSNSTNAGGESYSQSFHQQLADKLQHDHQQEQERVQKQQQEKQERVQKQQQEDCEQAKSKAVASKTVSMSVSKSTNTGGESYSQSIQKQLADELKQHQQQKREWMQKQQQKEEQLLQKQLQEKVHMLKQVHERLREQLRVDEEKELQQLQDRQKQQDLKLKEREVKEREMLLKQQRENATASKTINSRRKPEYKLQDFASISNLLKMSRSQLKATNLSSNKQTEGSKQHPASKNEKVQEAGKNKDCIQPTGLVSPTGNKTVQNEADDSSSQLNTNSSSESEIQDDFVTVGGPVRVEIPQGARNNGDSNQEINKNTQENSMVPKILSSTISGPYAQPQKVPHYGAVASPPTHLPVSIQAIQQQMKANIAPNSCAYMRLEQWPYIACRLSTPVTHL